jgi:hypothetical protein
MLKLHSGFVSILVLALMTLAPLDASRGQDGGRRQPAAAAAPCGAEGETPQACQTADAPAPAGPGSAPIPDATCPHCGLGSKIEPGKTELCPHCGEPVYSPTEHERARTRTDEAAKKLEEVLRKIQGGCYHDMTLTGAADHFEQAVQEEKDTDPALMADQAAVDGLSNSDKSAYDLAIKRLADDSERIDREIHERLRKLGFSRVAGASKCPSRAETPKSADELTRETDRAAESLAKAHKRFVAGAKCFDDAIEFELLKKRREEWDAAVEAELSADPEVAANRSLRDSTRERADALQSDRTATREEKATADKDAETARDHYNRALRAARERITKRSTAISPAESEDCPRQAAPPPPPPPKVPVEKGCVPQDKAEQSVPKAGGESTSMAPDAHLLRSVVTDQAICPLGVVVAPVARPGREDSDDRDPR